VTTAFVPRHSVEAEESLIGSALYSRAAAEALVMNLRPEDFYIPANQRVAAAIIELQTNGIQIDVMTVHSELQRTGERASAAELVHVVSNADATASHAESYIAIIRRESNARELDRAAREIQAELANGIDPAAAADSLEERLHALDRGSRLPENYWRDAGDYVAADHVEVGVPLFENGCYQHTRIIVLASEKAGKALAIDTPIPTPSGWTTMGALVVGHEVFGTDGKPRRIVAATDVMFGHECYRLTFNDGRSVIADADHLWRTNGYLERQFGRNGWTLHTTAELATTVEARGGVTKNHQIELAAPLKFAPLGTLPVRPYTLGAWLGDGHSRGASITCIDEQIMKEIEADGYDVARRSPKYLWSIKVPLAAKVERPRNNGGRLPVMNTIGGRLGALGLLRNKHIPELYFRASVEDRLALLQGLMDTDGTCSARRAQCEITLMNEHLARDVRRLITELGIRSSIRESDAKLDGRVVGRRWRVRFSTSLPVFRLERKAMRQTPRPTTVTERRAIIAIERVASVPVRCIQVEHADGMYLAGDGCIPTHNSMMLRQMAYCLAAGLHPWTFAKIEPVRVLLADCENDGDELIPTMRRLDALIAKYAGDGAARPSLFSAPYGLDLRSRRDRGEFESVLEDCRPQLIIGGPVYKIMPRRESEDVDTHALAFGHLFDSFRKRWGCALMIEHHAPTGRQGETRELRSKGGQQWAAWPEVTVSLTAKTTPDGLAYFQVGFPHPTRGKFRWPKRFDRGEDHDWPWVPVLRAADVKKPDPPSVPRSFYETDREESF
jgi:hypothetical protein